MHGPDDACKSGMLHSRTKLAAKVGAVRLSQLVGSLHSASKLHVLGLHCRLLQVNDDLSAVRGGCMCLAGLHRLHLQQHHVPCV